MNFRIERRVGSENEVVLNLCGRIHSDQLATIKESMGLEPRSIVLDLTEITIADRHAAVFLAKCEAQGMELRNTPAFLSEWIAREKSQMTAETF
jgi:hypothetical protein